MDVAGKGSHQLEGKGPELFQKECSRHWELRGPRVAALSWGDRVFKADSSQGQLSPPHLPPQQGAGLCVLPREGKTALRVATSSANRRHIMGMLPGPWAAGVLAGVRGGLSWLVRGLVCSLCLAEPSCVHGNWVPTTQHRRLEARHATPSPNGPLGVQEVGWGWGKGSILALAKPEESVGAASGQPGPNHISPEI